MPFRRKRASLLQRTKQGIKTSKTQILTIGSASAPTEYQVLVTDVGARTTTGGTQQIRDVASTEEDVTVGSIVKYINLHLQGCSRPDEVGASEDKGIGWIEYALVMVKETETVMPITNLGTTTVGDIATKMYRNECIWTGAMPISQSVSNAQTLTIKVPRNKQRISIGDHWRLYLYYRDALVTGTSTNTCRVIVSQNMKVYN